MCRSIKTLRRVEPVAEDEVRGAALQYVRKISGMRQPTRQATEAFEAAVDEVTEATRRLLALMGPPRGTARMSTLEQPARD